MSTFRTLAMVCSIGIFVGSLFVRTPKINELNQLPQVDRHAGKKTYNVITSDMIKKPIFWIYYFLTVLFGGVGLAIINHCSPIMIEGLHVDAAFAAMIISITSISNGVGRFIWGMVFDKIGVKKCLLIISAFFLVASSAIFIGFSFESIPLFIAGACLMLISYGGNAITCPAVVREMFGHRTFSLNYSVLATDAVFTSFFPSIIGMVQVATGAYSVPLLLLIVISVVALATMILFARMYHKEYEINNV